jgi:hypothetical protein
MEADVLLQHPSEIVLEFRFRTSGHIATASVTRHLTAKQSHILQKVDVNLLVAEEICEKQLVHIAVVSKRGMHIGCCVNERHLH